MSDAFTKFFRDATRTEREPSGRDPYPYQARFAESPVLPHLLRAPTGAGKTATAVLGWLWRLQNPTTYPGTPRRLVYCLPMRVLVEQSHREASDWLGALKLRNEVCLPLPLMGGSDSGDWHLYPEKPAVLIGTQDMLLSRALNRGYAASRFHWPIDFGLLNNDCLWVFDEPQLMANGVSTSAQLAGLRHENALGTFGSCPSVWMSATLEPGWLETIDFRGKFTTPPLELDETDYATESLNRRMTAEKTLAPLGVSFTKEADDKEVKAVATKILEKHCETPGTQTLVVLNTVKRARKVYESLQVLRKKAVSPQLLLVHSRFRPWERVGEQDAAGNVIRKGLNHQLQEKGDATKDRIIVATQVVEAGVDISARTLITELAPWASIVQRIGRCNRTGDDRPGRVFWIDSSAKDPEKKEDRQAALPYSVEELVHARNRLNELEGKDVSPLSLTPYKLDPTFPHKHVIRRRDLLDLFDTSPDLSGNDIDVSRFVRSDDPDTDVKVFWRDSPPERDWDAKERRRQLPRRIELCNVPIGNFKDEFLKAGKTAYRFDQLDGKWQVVRKQDVGTVIPGQVFWVAADQGGYNAELGWSPGESRLPKSLVVPLPNTLQKRRGERPEGYYDSDEWARQSEWRTLAEHTEEVVKAILAILALEYRLPLTDELRTLLKVAARWHDWGKAHPVFQSGIATEIVDPKTKDLPKEERRKCQRPEKWRDVPFIAKAPDEFWKRYERYLAQAGEPEKPKKVKRFRHELASALGVLALERVGILPIDWNGLTPQHRWLALYLIASHHGKVRLSIRTMPDEKPIPQDADCRRFAAGVWDRDKLPGTPLDGASQVSPPEVELLLAPMQLGGDESWSARVLALRNEFGPFRLAYLEAVLRAADCRASGDLDVEEATDA